MSQNCFSNYILHITRTIILSKNPFILFPFSSTFLDILLFTSKNPTDLFQFLRFTRLRNMDRPVFSKSFHLSFSKYFLRRSSPFIPNVTHSPRKNPPSPTPSRQKTSFSKPQPFRAGAARETHLPRHVLPSSLPPSSSFTRAPFRHTYTHSRGQRVRKLGVHDGVTSRKPGSISRRAIRSTAKAPLASFRPFQPSSFLRVCLFSPFRPPPFSPCTRLTDPGGGGGGGRLC